MSAQSRLQMMFKQRWRRWLDRRIPRQTTVTLNQRRIFIFLTRQGFTAALVVLALFVAGINYANNLLLGLSFFVGSIIVVVIHHTYANLSGLRITALTAKPAFAGEPANFVLALDDVRERDHESLQLDWDGVVQTVPWVNGRLEVAVPLPTQKRGWMRPPRLRLQSVYPLGLLRAWTWLDLDMAALVYPHPEACDVMPVAPSGQGEGERQRRRGHDDFDSLKSFTPGDPLAHVAWKHLARGQGLLTKTFASEEAGSELLDFEAMPGVPIETRLSRLCWWVLTLSQHNHSYGLRLPGTEIAPDIGLEHQEACLRALALFGREGRQP